jgi:hypothetical protein
MLAFWRAVIAALSRNPVYAWHWIPDVVTPDLIRGRDDNSWPPGGLSMLAFWRAVIAALSRNPVCVRGTGSRML